MAGEEFNQLIRNFPAHQTNGRCSIDVAGILLPLHDERRREGVRFWYIDASSRPEDLDALFGNEPAVPSAHEGTVPAIVVRPPGEFHSIDEFQVQRIEIYSDALRVECMVTEVENVNGIPAPRDLFVVMRLDVDRIHLRTVLLDLKRRTRDATGAETDDDLPAGAPITIELPA
ncbi:MAG TPA: hypothetical protein VHI13_21265 [Candidatus Kapabacteria bacterium]|nr:hypothetical protein [Candidatus Kapabacteria bacterium]